MKNNLWIYAKLLVLFLTQLFVAAMFEWFALGLTIAYCVIFGISLFLLNTKKGMRIFSIVVDCLVFLSCVAFIELLASWESDLGHVAVIVVFLYPAFAVSILFLIFDIIRLCQKTYKCQKKFPIFMDIFIIICGAIFLCEALMFEYAPVTCISNFVIIFGIVFLLIDINRIQQLKVQMPEKRTTNKAAKRIIQVVYLIVVIGGGLALSFFGLMSGL